MQVLCKSIANNSQQPRTGSGTQCEMCPADFFKNDTSSVDCTPCPADSQAPPGSTSRKNCKCEVGELFEKNGQWKLDRKRGCAPFFFFLSCLMFIGVSVTLNLGRCARNDTSEFGMPERKIMQGFDLFAGLTFILPSFTATSAFKTYF